MSKACAKRAKTVQKSSNTVKLYHDIVHLDPGFPVSCTVTELYSPDPELTGLHWHDMLEVGYCYEGSGVFIVNHQVESFSEGYASVIFGDELHIARSRVEGGSHWRFVHLDPEGLLGRRYPEFERQLCLRRKSLPFLFSMDADDGIALLIKDLIYESSHRDSSSWMGVHGIVLRLMSRLSDFSDISDEPAIERQPLHRISPAIEHVLFHYEEEITIPKLASLCGMSLSTFQRTFFRSMGISPGKYTQQIRIRMACLMLRSTDQTILEIAEQVGYGSLSSFNRHFLQQTGVAPREYRKHSPNNQARSNMSHH